MECGERENSRRVNYSLRMAGTKFIRKTTTTEEKKMFKTKLKQTNAHWEKMSQARLKCFVLELKVKKVQFFILPKKYFSNFVQFLTLNWVQFVCEVLVKKCCL